MAIPEERDLPIRVRQHVQLHPVQGHPVLFPSAGADLKCIHLHHSSSCNHKIVDSEILESEIVFVGQVQEGHEAGLDAHVRCVRLLLLAQAVEAVDETRSSRLECGQHLLQILLYFPY